MHDMNKESNDHIVQCRTNGQLHTIILHHMPLQLEPVLFHKNN